MELLQNIIQFNLFKLIAAIMFFLNLMQHLWLPYNIILHSDIVQEECNDDDKWISEPLVCQGRRHIIYARVHWPSDLFNLNIYRKSRHVVMKSIAIQHGYVYINFSSYVLSSLSPVLPFLFVIMITVCPSVFVIILYDCYQGEE